MTDSEDSGRGQPPAAWAWRTNHPAQRARRAAICSGRVQPPAVRGGFRRPPAAKARVPLPANRARGFRRPRQGLLRDLPVPPLEPEPIL